MSIHRTYTSGVGTVLQLILMTWLFSGCAGSKNTSVSAPPLWVSERPVSPSHYIGIGSAAFHEGQEAAMETAKKRAAADLASEIAVKVESASLLESAESNGQVSEEFSSSISSRAEAEVVRPFGRSIPPPPSVSYQGYEHLGNLQNSLSSSYSFVSPMLRKGGGPLA